MNLNLCNNCGGEFEYRNNQWICRGCGCCKSEATASEEAALLYMAFRKLRLSEFYEAEQDFDDIIVKYPYNPNGYWGRLMSKYGIKYEQDFDGRMIPTCYATSIESIIKDNDYQKALEYADEETRNYYVKQAEYIERIRKEWVEKAKKEKPYDIFICYKESDLANNIDRTQDSFMAQELYIHLTKKGYRVFFSHESLRDKVGEKYEPYIFNALATAKVMIVYGSRPDYISSTWLKNEWTRYEKRIQTGEKASNSLLVACEGFSPSELPHALSSKQCFNANDKSFYSDLDESIEKIIHSDQKIAGSPRKNKTPLIIALFLLLAASIGIFALNFFGGVSIVSNTTYGATVSGGEFPKRTQLYIKRVSDAQWKSVVETLSVDQEMYYLYDMELRCNGNALDVDGNMTVTFQLPYGIFEEDAVVYYMSGASPQVIPSQISDGKIIFITEHFGVCMLANKSCTHIPVVNEAISATCTEDGTSEWSYCSLCNEILVEQITIPAAHMPGTNADCYNGQHCVICQVELKPALGHAPSMGATCTTAQFCTICRIELNAAHGHVPGAAATCTTAQICTVCDEKLQPATGHTSGAVATCTTAQTCTVCYEELQPATGHTPSEEATCTTAQICTVCYEELQSATGHTPGAEATCVTAQTCTVCYEDLQPAAGHTPGAEATCVTAQMCTVCYVELQSATGHTPGEEATCTTAQICTVCGTVLVPSSHKPGPEATCMTAQMCTVCYEELQSATGHTPSEEATCTTYQYCLECNIILAHEFGHTMGDWVIVTPSTKTENGLKERYCITCSEVMESEIIYAGSYGLSYSIFHGTDTCVITGIGSCTDAEIVIPRMIDSCRVIGIDEIAFNDCNRVTSIIIPDTVTSIGASAFYGCIDLKSISIPESVTSIGAGAFTNCGKLTNVVIPDSVSTLGECVFSGCSRLKNVVLPVGLTSIPKYTFLNCTLLEAVVVPDGVISIGESAFSACDNLSSISLPESVTSIGAGAFTNCNRLQSIELPSGILTIGEGAFSACYEVTSVIIPASLTNIGENVFAHIYLMDKIYYGGTIAQWIALTSGTNWDGYTGSYIVYCSDGNVSKGTT